MSNIIIDGLVTALGHVEGSDPSDPLDVLKRLTEATNLLHQTQDEIAQHRYELVLQLKAESWTNARIANELGVSPQAIGQLLHRRQRRQRGQ